MVSSVKELRRLANKQARSKVLLRNPVDKDFNIKYAGYDEVIIKANSIEEVNGGISERVKKALVDFVINTRKLDPMKREPIEKEVTCE